MSEEYDEVADALGLPEPDEDEPAGEEGQEASETEQNTSGSEAGTDTGDAETGSEGSDTGEPEPEAAEAKSDSEIAQLMAKLESMEKTNTGLYREMKEERDKRKRFEDEIKRMASEQEAAKKRAEAEANIPDKDEDPAGYLQAQVDRRMSELSERFDKMEQTREQQAQAEVYRQAEQAVATDEQQFVSQKEDYYDALNFAREERARLLRATHPDQPDEWVQGMIQQGDRMFALQSLQQGVSPAQRAYDYAVRLGYKPGQSTGNGGQPAPDAAPAPAGQPVKRPAQRPQQTSLSSVSSKPGGRGTKYTAEDVARLDLDKPADVAIFDKIMGNQALRVQLEETGSVQL